MNSVEGTPDPVAAIPATDECNLPTAYQRVCRPVAVAADLLPFSKGQFPNAIPCDPVRRHLAGVRIAEPQPLLRRRIRVAENLNVLRHGRRRPAIKAARRVCADACGTRCESARVVCSHRAREHIKCLKCQPIRESPFNIDLRRVAIEKPLCCSAPKLPVMFQLGLIRRRSAFVGARLPVAA